MKCVISNQNCKYQIHLQNPLTFSAGTTIDITAEKITMKILQNVPNAKLI